MKAGECYVAGFPVGVLSSSTDFVFLSGYENACKASSGLPPPRQVEGVKALHQHYFFLVSTENNTHRFAYTSCTAGVAEEVVS